jgi:hypothetical protein
MVVPSGKVYIKVLEYKIQCMDKFCTWERTISLNKKNYVKYENCPALKYTIAGFPKCNITNDYLQYEEFSEKNIKKRINVIRNADCILSTIDCVDSSK